MRRSTTICSAAIFITLFLSTALAQTQRSKPKSTAQPPQNQSQAAHEVSNQPETRAAQPAAEPTPGPEAIYSQLNYRFIGPPGNRVSAVVGEPGNPKVYYAGAASGGVWKSDDGGFHWKPIFDKEDAQSIGSIAVAPSDPSVLWVGTGETWIRSNVSLGNGVYKSIDGGKNWQHMGLDKTGRIGRIIIDPRDPNVVYVAALGTCYGPQQERGVYRTTDGGKTWQRVLFVDENTGVSELTIDPTNPQKLIAGTWSIVIHTWGRDSGGPGSGIFVTQDGGNTWKRVVGHGLPASPLGRIAVEIAPNNPERVYALIETGQRGSLWRSDDGGANWKVVNYSRLLNERPHYYTRMLVMPDNYNEVYFPSNSMSVTYDGGQTAELIRWGGDNHDMWADPKDPNRIMIGHDGGVMLSTVRGKEWESIRLPIAQIYHVATDNKIPYDVYGQMQDGSPQHGPSRNLGSGGFGAQGIPASAWTTTAGCETGWNIPDPVDPDIVWGGCYAGVTEVFNAKNGHARDVSVWPERTMGAPAGEVKLRMNWTYPIAISPFDHNTVYVGSQYVHKTTDGGQTWQTISPDLTLNDKSMMGDSGGLTVDNLSVEYAGVVFSIEESPLEKGQIWAGTNDGLVQMTRDGGAHWTNVTPKGIPPKMTVVSVDPSKYNAGTCYVAFDGHQVDVFDPYLFKTTDYGKTWTRIVNGIPASPLSYTNVVREDPVRRGLLYAGTENALYVSFNDGENWQPLQNNLPHAPVHWLTVQPKFNDLVVGTYGRGYWILDDVTPLQQLTDQVRNSEAYLFPVREAYRFRATFRRDMAPVGQSLGQNPPYGADINYLLKSALPEKQQATITILGADGAVIRTIKGTGHAGINRVYWDLRYPQTTEVQLRTTPPGNPHIWEEKRFVGKDSRGVFYYGVGGEPTMGPLVVPGEYTVKLSVGGKDYTQKVRVLKDPNTGATENDVAESSKLSLEIYRNVNEVVRMINQIEWTRKQLEDMKKMLGAEHADPSLAGSVDEFDAKARGIEDRLLQKNIAEGDLKSFRGALQLYLKFIWLGAEVGSGGADVSGNADYAPTPSEVEVFNLLQQRLNAAKTDFDDFYAKQLPAFNEQMSGKGLGRVMAVKIQ
ncbi:MAG TPA: hypothetical protein VFU76_14910 [Terriglobales bacterium]|nr:hypothetical protein [Terriglobales bacterium]